MQTTTIFEPCPNCIWNTFNPHLNFIQIIFEPHSNHIGATRIGQARTSAPEAGVHARVRPQMHLCGPVDVDPLNRPWPRDKLVDMAAAEGSVPMLAWARAQLPPCT